MPEPLYEYDPGALTAGQVAFGEATRRVRTALDTLANGLNGALANWNDEGYSQYTYHKAQWDQSIIDMEGVLGHSAMALGTIGENYQAAERGNQELWL